ncbi:MAG TPA: hypothetical protein ACQGQH_01905 [Xylella sp.]
MSGGRIGILPLTEDMCLAGCDEAISIGGFDKGAIPTLDWNAEGYMQ